MNISFFLTPKSDVAYEKATSTMRQAMEKIEYNGYTAIPIIDDKGKYVGTLTEGDLLRKLKNTPGLDFMNTNKVVLSDVNFRTNNKPVRITCNVEDLVVTSINQNFVPVVDDNDIFIGIIKRSDIITYCYKKLFDQKES
ncbi:MAG: CBS domain-containing protein [Bacillota bacterium]|nr:CBS domain-containing protein [Bacillota bacterium]